MWIILGLIIFLVCLLVYQDYSKKNSRRWKLLSQFPGDTPLPLIGNALQIGLDSDEMSHNLMEMWKRHGKQTFRVTVGSEDWVLLCNTDDVGVILSHPTEISKPVERNAAMMPFFGNSMSTSEGERWRATRKLVNSSFNFKTMEQKVVIVNKFCDRLLDILDVEKEKGPVDMYRYIKPYMFDTVANNLMGVNYKFLEDVDCQYLERAKNIIYMMTANYFSYWRNFHPIFILTPMYREMMATIKHIKDTSTDIITQRRTKLKVMENNNNNVFNDKQKETTQNKSDEGCLLDKFLLGTMPNGNPIPDEITSEEISLICFTGHYTTSLTMCHTLYMLAKYPEVQKRVIDEQLSIFQDDKLKKPTNEDLNEMKYLDAAIKETIRLIPTVAKIGRQLHEDLKLKDGRLIPAGSSVVVFYEALFSNEELFPEPEKFMPERFFETLRPYSFVSFSAGPRNCVGARYAWMAIKATLSNLIRRFEILEGGPGTEPQIVNRIVTESKNGMQLRLRKRTL